MKTRAIVFAAPNDASICSVDVPPPRKHEVQIRSSYSTISAGTEGWILRNLMTWSPTHFPCIPGYQRSGIVTAVGLGVSGWTVGDRALAVTGIWSNPEVARAFGGHIAVANVPTTFAYHLSDQLDDIDASSAVLAQVGHNAAKRANCAAGDWVLVFGDGLVGQFSAQAARASDARVILVGHRAERLELARQYSADVVINGAAADVARVVRQTVGADGVRVVLDSVQTPASQEQYIDLIKRGSGQIVYNGFNPDDHWANLGLFQKRELTTHFVLHWTRERMEATLALMASGSLRAAPLITHVVPYTRGPDMYRMLLAKHEPFLGIALDWTSAVNERE